MEQRLIVHPTANNKGSSITAEPIYLEVYSHVPSWLHASDPIYQMHLVSSQPAAPLTSASQAAYLEACLLLLDVRNFLDVRNSKVSFITFPSPKYYYSGKCDYSYYMRALDHERLPTMEVACRTNDVNLFRSLVDQGIIKLHAELAAKYGSVDVLKLILDIKPYSVQRMLRCAIGGRIRSTEEMLRGGYDNEPVPTSNYPATCEMLIMRGAKKWHKLHLNKTQILRLYRSGKVSMDTFWLNSPRYTRQCPDESTWNSRGCLLPRRYVKWIRQYTVWKKHAEMQMLRCKGIAQDVVKRLVMSFL